MQSRQKGPSFFRKNLNLMRMNQKPPTKHNVLLAVVCALFAFCLPAFAHPYASGLTATNAAGDVGFFMNETGATVTVTFEDASSLSLGVLPKGTNHFNMAGHSSYTISCYHPGSGSPTLITDDTATYSVWSNGCGVAVNKNPKNGPVFGRLYAGNNFPFGGANAKQAGIYALNADQTLVTFAGPTNI